MRKISTIFLTILIGLSVFLLGFDYKKETTPNEYYQVYLNGELIGNIESEEELEKYIDQQGEKYKKQYNVETIHKPLRLEVKKVLTYKEEIDTIEDIYLKIKEKSPFTINGYQLTVKKDKSNMKIYATSMDIIKEAINTTIVTFVGEDEYNAYVNGDQKEIETTGSIINNIYVKEEMTYKNVNISVEEKIYNSATELSQFLIFGNNNEKKTYTVAEGDTIEKVALKNEISVNEFLLSNPTFTSQKNLLYPGQKVLIGVTDPQLSVVVEQFLIEDVESNFKIVEKYDDTKYVGYEAVTQKGKKGLDRVSRNVQITNGQVTYVDTVSKKVLKSPVNKIIVLGSKKVSSIGSTKNWGWPTNSGWYISSDYAWRIDPFGGGREFHGGIDITGTGYGSPIYAANNGTVIVATKNGGSYGYYIVIDHNNGYYTLYAHLSKILVTEGQVIERGAQIGAMGMTGSATGPHLHYEAWHGGKWKRIDPKSLYN